MRYPPLLPFAEGPLCAVIVTMLLFSCSPRPGIDPRGSTLLPCPAPPNCVSSDSKDQRHGIAPLLLPAPNENTWPRIRATVLSLPQTKLLSEGANNLHVECRSALLGFVDDLQLQWRPGEGVLAVRSASRTGYYDFGVNRRRVEKLRRLLQDRGLLRPAGP